MSAILPPGVIQRANFVDLDKNDILDVSNAIHTLKENLSTVQLTIIKVQKDLNDQLQVVTLTQQSLEDANANEKSIVESISRGEALLAPSAIRRLPAEILGEIFLHFLDLCFPESHPTILQTQNLLLHVCRRWRQTMISDPRFWQTIPVGCFGGDRPTAWEMLKERISRAGCTQDLHVLLTMDVSDNASQSRLIQTVLDLLPRATTFEMNINYSFGDVDTLPRPTEETYGNLKEVVLGVVCASYGSWIHNILSRASDLKALRCSTLSTKFIPVSCLGRLRCLRLDCRISLNDISRILAYAPLLAELHVKDIRRGGGPTPLTTTTPSPHEQLETLRVDSADFEFLELFTLPGLRHLSFGRAPEYTPRESDLDSCQYYHRVQWPSKSGSTFFERSNCKLISLELIDLAVSPEVVDILRSQECLETLYFCSKSPTVSAILSFLEENLSSLTRLRVCVTHDQIPASVAAR